jgi:hypothetical protein
MARRGYSTQTNDTEPEKPASSKSKNPSPEEGVLDKKKHINEAHIRF